MIEYRMEPSGTAGEQTASGQLPTSTSMEKTKKKNVYILGERGGGREQLPTRSHSALLMLTEDIIREGWSGKTSLSEES